MVISLFITAAGIIFIFVANATNDAVSPGLIGFGCVSIATVLVAAVGQRLIFKLPNQTQEANGFSIF